MVHPSLVRENAKGLKAGRFRLLANGTSPGTTSFIIDDPLPKYNIPFVRLLSSQLVPLLPLGLRLHFETGIFIARHRGKEMTIFLKIYFENVE